jgi:hypothetical protein
LGARLYIADSISGIVNESLKNFLEMNLPKVKAGKKAKFSVGVVSDALLASLRTLAVGTRVILQYFATNHHAMRAG